MFRFSARRWLAFAAILGLVYFLAFFGLWVSMLVPLVGTALFVAGLMVWFVPGVVFSWTGFFKFHEFGASPTGWEGHAVMLLFYAAIALLLSWPFAPKRARNRPLERDGSPLS